MIANLNIPSLGIKYPVLSSTSTALLKISLNKYWGANPNEVGNMKTPLPEAVDNLMKDLLKEYNSKKEKTFEDILDFHVQFERIHPFQDGNGRVGRIIAFKECLKNNIIPFIILDKDKLFYYRGLNQYQNNKEKGYLIDTCLNAQDQYCRMIEHFLKQ